jgi:hypothetical protein
MVWIVADLYAAQTVCVDFLSSPVEGAYAVMKSYYEIKKPPAARGRFLKKLPPGPPQKLLINFIRLRAWLIS